MVFKEDSARTATMTKRNRKLLVEVDVIVLEVVYR